MNQRWYFSKRFNEKLFEIYFQRFWRDLVELDIVPIYEKYQNKTNV